MIDLAYRSGEVTIVQAHAVHENDTFDYALGLDPRLNHIPAPTNRGDTIAYYAVFKTKSGGYGFQVTSRDDMVAFAKKYSKAFAKGSSTPWMTNFDEMAKKTVLKAALKYAPLKSDFARAVASDETVKSHIDADMSIVNNEIVYEVNEQTGEVTEIPAEEESHE